MKKRKSRAVWQLCFKELVVCIQIKMAKIKVAVCTGFFSPLVGSQFLSFLNCRQNCENGLKICKSQRILAPVGWLNSTWITTNHIKCSDFEIRLLIQSIISQKFSTGWYFNFVYFNFSGGYWHRINRELFFSWIHA